MWMDIMPACIIVHYACAIPAETRREYQTPWSQSYRCGLPYRRSVRVTILNYDTFPQPSHPFSWIFFVVQLLLPDSLSYLEFNYCLPCYLLKANCILPTGKV